MKKFCFLAIDGKKGTLYEGKPDAGTTAQVTITVDDDDFVQLATGKANAPAVSHINFMCLENFSIFLSSSLLH